MQFLFFKTDANKVEYVAKPFFFFNMCMHIKNWEGNAVDQQNDCD